VEWPEFDWVADCDANYENCVSFKNPTLQLNELPRGYKRYIMNTDLGLSSGTTAIFFNVGSVRGIGTGFEYDEGFMSAQRALERFRDVVNSYGTLTCNIDWTRNKVYELRWTSTQGTLLVDDTSFSRALGLQGLTLVSGGPPAEAPASIVYKWTVDNVQVPSQLVPATGIWVDHQ
jgi:hypothetical protein